MGGDQSASTGGTLYASARAWFSTRLQEAEIAAESISAVVDATAEGSAKVAVRDKCGHDVISASARLRIRIEDTSIRWSLRINSDTRQGSPKLIIVANADAHIGDVNMTFDGVLAAPPPLDQVENWIRDTIINEIITPVLSQVASEKASIRLVQTEQNNGDMRLHLWTIGSSLARLR
ncbi:hypothetical protein BKA63DRAFT_229241 [Paraphoma chrysanthemicola]|nr:hypothetical protein BKA63DRAFT_229241 [Paraphoma chrysanthemicola]